MDKTKVTQEAAQYVSLFESQAAFCREALRKIVTDGTGLVQIAGGLAQAARRIRKIQLQGVQYDRDFIESTQHLYRNIACGVMSIYTRGAMSAYRPLSPKPVPGDGYPRNPKRAEEIIESIWADIRRRKVAV